MSYLALSIATIIFIITLFNFVILPKVLKIKESFFGLRNNKDTSKYKFKFLERRSIPSFNPQKFEDNRGEPNRKYSLKEMFFNRENDFSSKKQAPKEGIEFPKNLFTPTPIKPSLVDENRKYSQKEVKLPFPNSNKKNEIYDKLSLRSSSVEFTKSKMTYNSSFMNTTVEPSYGVISKINRQNRIGFGRNEGYGSKSKDVFNRQVSLSSNKKIFDFH